MLARASHDSPQAFSRALLRSCHAARIRGRLGSGLQRQRRYGPKSVLSAVDLRFATSRTRPARYQHSRPGDLPFRPGTLSCVCVSQPRSHRDLGRRSCLLNGQTGRDIEAGGEKLGCNRMAKSGHRRVTMPHPRPVLYCNARAASSADFSSAEEILSLLPGPPALQLVRKELLPGVSMEFVGEQLFR